MNLWDQSFAYALAAGGEVSDEPLTLSPEAQTELNAALDDIARCRARAAVTAQNYMVWR